eukprot:TRINITY_DN14742_c0_g1_i1.p1 TRINITY_DN14742_c0_g1~~TRINITY_DN14742_c0_g1_i1.p1  ORF type:complete len:116 (+),score=18.02 TRINITY_DN14742_c0_g1_i1:117-464(+)
MCIRDSNSCIRSTRCPPEHTPSALSRCTEFGERNTSWSALPSYPSSDTALASCSHPHSCSHCLISELLQLYGSAGVGREHSVKGSSVVSSKSSSCLLYTSPSPRDRTRSRMPSSA